MKGRSRALLLLLPLLSPCDDSGDMTCPDLVNNSEWSTRSMEKTPIRVIHCC